MAKKGIRHRTNEERIEVATTICEMYKLGHDIVSCCKAANISFNAFYFWIAKYPKINEIYKDTLQITKKNEYSLMQSLGRSALIENLSGNAKDIKTVTVKETVKVVTRGKVEYVPIEKEIIEVIKKAPSMAAVRLALEKLDPAFKKDVEEIPDTEAQSNEFIEKRNKFLEEKLNELEERYKDK